MRHYSAKYCDHVLMEISSLILASLFRQCSHQVMNRAVLKKDARTGEKQGLDSHSRTHTTITRRGNTRKPQHLKKTQCLFSSHNSGSLVISCGILSFSE